MKRKRDGVHDLILNVSYFAAAEISSWMPILSLPAPGKQTFLQALGTM